MDGGSKYEGSQSLLESQTAMSSAVGDASVTIATPNAASQNIKPNVSTGDASPARDHDRLVPMTNVIRIMRKALPSHAKISEEAKETVQQCVSEYINFITSEANDRCQLEQRKTVTADDILWAMRKLGFDDYVEPLSLYLRRYREIEGDHRGSIRGDLLTPPLKPSYSQVNTSAMATFYGDVPPLSSPAPSQMAQSPQGVYPDGATRYYLDVYGDGSGAGGSSSSSQGNLMGGEFDPHASFM